MILGLMHSKSTSRFCSDLGSLASSRSLIRRPVPEIIDPVFTKTSQNAGFLLSENERFGLVFVKTGSINSGTVCCLFISERRVKIITLYWSKSGNVL